jgi:gas vesicle protein
MPHHEHGQSKQPGRAGTGKVVLVGVLGAAVGAVAALLLSPWRGAEARLRLKDRAKDLGSKAKDMAARAKDALPTKKGEE